MYLHKNESSFSQIIELKNINELLEIFNVSASKYWNEHYHFDKKTKIKIKKLGLKAAESVIINGIIPTMFIYGHYTAKTAHSNKALHFLESLKGENNSITTNWAELNLPTKNALQTQALIELKTQYCDFKKCLDCEFGCELLNKN